MRDAATPARAAILFFAGAGFLRKDFLPRAAFLRGAAFFLDFLGFRELDLVAMAGCYHDLFILTIECIVAGRPCQLFLMAAATASFTMTSLRL